MGKAKTEARRDHPGRRRCRVKTIEIIVDAHRRHVALNVLILELNPLSENSGNDKKSFPLRIRL